MEINKNLSEFVWEYSSNHDFVSRAIVSGMFMDKFERWEGRNERRTLQKTLERKISSMFRVMKQLGISEKYSQKTIKINREVFERFSLEDILKFSFTKKQS